MLIMADGKNSVGVGGIFAGSDRDDSVQFLSAGGVNTLDVGVRVGGMQSLADEHSRQAEIVSVFGRAGGFASGVDHGDGLADDGEVVWHWFVAPASGRLSGGRHARLSGRRDGGATSLLRLNCSFDCLIHLAVSGAAAQISAESAANFVFRRFWILGQQMLYRHDESRSAESTLRAAPVAIAFLNRGHTAMTADPFDRGNILPLATGRKHREREYGYDVEQTSAHPVR